MFKLNQVKRTEFWSYVNKADSCWEWTGSRSDRTGYGRFFIKPGKAVGAHRIAYFLTFGTFDTKLFVCHICDNRPCVRPDHLFLGTSKDNVQDCISKNRFVSNIDRFAKLSLVQVRNICKLFNTNEFTYVELAEMFDITKESVKNIVTCRTWKHFT